MLFIICTDRRNFKFMLNIPYGIADYKNHAYAKNPKTYVVEIQLTRLRSS